MIISMTTLVTLVLPIALRQIKEYVDGKYKEKIEELKDQKRIAKENGDIEAEKRIAECEHQLDLEMEREAHIYRSSLIEKAYDEFLETKADEAAIKAWPLEVLPFVVNGRGFGPSIRGCRNVAVHAFMAPSNSTNFNRDLWSAVDGHVDRNFGRYRRMASRHSVCYYGNAWRKKNVDKTSVGNLVEMIHTKLHSTPLISVTPFFENDDVILRIMISGFGAKQAASYDVAVPDGVCGDSEALRELLHTPVYGSGVVASKPAMISLAKSLADYITLTVGYLVDMYYWEFYRIVPCLPSIADGLGFDAPVLAAARESYFDTAGQVLTAVPDTTLARTDAQLAREYLDAVSAVLDKNQKAFLESNLACAAGNVAEISVKTQPLDSSRIDPTVVQERYTEYRDILVDVLGKACLVRELTPEELNVFATSMRRLTTDEFNVVLIGEFQGGKSTTFNALCGGREISPRGKGIKTSAICITATALADKDAAEYSDVAWKTDRQLLDSISALTRDITAEDLNAAVKEGDAFVLADHFNLSNPLHMEVLRRCIDEQIMLLPMASDRNMMLDQIRLAAIIHAFYSNPAIRRLKEKTRYGVDDVARFVVFPEKWATSWHKSQDVGAEFTADQVAFAFIDSIGVYIHSRELSRLGCSITDCPGLFASSYDTVVAMRAMARANAIIYLLNGEKEMGEVDERVVRMIGESDTLASRTFFAVNERTNPVKTQNIINQDKMRISDILGRETEVSISPYNALLYFLSETGRKYAGGHLDVVSESRFLDVAEKSGFPAQGFTQVWMELVESIGFAVRNKALMAVDGLTAESAEVCAVESHGSEVMGLVNSFILKDKARSIIVDNGVNRICRAVDAVDARLAKREADAAKTAEQKRKEADAARKAIDDFEKRLTEICTKAVTPHTVKLIADAAYTHEVTSAEVISAITLKLAVEIPKKLTLAMKADAAFNGVMEKISSGKAQQGNSAMMKKRFNDKIEPVVKDIISSEINRRISLWTIEMQEGRHDSYVHHIKPLLEHAATQIAEQWQKEVSANPDLGVFNLTTPDMTKPMADVGSTFVNDSANVKKAIEKAAIDKLISDIVGNIVCVMTGIVIGCIYDLFVTGGIGTIIMAIYSTLGYLFARMVKGGIESDSDAVKSVNELNRNQRKLYTSLFPELSKAFSSEANRNNILAQLKAVPDGIGANFLKHFRTQLKDFRKQLDQSLEEALADSRESTEKLRLVAEQARRVRMLEIAPLTEELNAFMTTLKTDAAK